MEIVILNSGPGHDRYLPIYQRTIGAYKVAHACRCHGFSVQVIDHVTRFSQPDLVELMAQFIDNETRILGISTTFIAPFNQMPQHVVLAISAIVEQFPNLKVVMGGYSIEAAKQICEFDTYAVVTQYGEDVFKDVANFLIRKQQEPRYTIGLHRHSGKVIKIYSEPLMQVHTIEQDSFKFHSDDAILPNETLPIEISRGCIFKCKFCNHLLLGRGKLDYLRNFELVREELIHNYNTWGTTSYYIICDTFNDTVYKMTEWHKMVTSLPFKIKYAAYLRADLLHKFDEVPHMLTESGLNSCFHGIESLDPGCSLAVGKGWSGKHAREFIPKLYHDIWKKKVFQSMGFIVGLPGDTRQKNIDTADWFIDNQLYCIVFKALGLTNNKMVKNLSEFERNAEKYGYRFEQPSANVSDYGLWINDYWSNREATQFVDEVINPKIAPHCGKLGAWDIAYFGGIDITQDKLKVTEYLSSHQQTLHAYKNLLLSKSR